MYYLQKIAEVGLTNNDIPLWFSEGVAEYISSDGIDISEINTKIVPFNELSTSVQWNKYRTNIIQYNIYLQSQQAIYFFD